MKTGIVITFFVAVMTACSSAQQPASMTTTNHYYGEVKTTSADGKIPYGPAKHSLVKRVIDKQNKTITEFVNQDGKDYNTKLTQVNNSTVFSAEDLSTKSFTGKITFTGKEWEWNAWSYDIAMNDGTGKIIGEGALTSDAIQTKKYFLAPDGTKRVLIVEDLKKITPEEYTKLLSVH